MTTTGSSPQYFVGCPAWSYKEWIGSIFEAEVEPKDLLRRYSRVFNAVEGNAFFYALPSLSTVERWMAESIEGFRFAPKFPKAISHERRLQHADEETAAFLRVLDALEHGHRLGPSFLQLPPSFNVNGFDALASYLKSLPKAFHYGVEVRHLSWFDDGPAERQLDDLLEGLGIDKVIFDSRPLFSSEEVDQGEALARSRKPHLPVRKTTTGQQPILRLVGRDRQSDNDDWIREWVPIVNKWILEGKRPYVFAHTANDALAPAFAQRFHDALRRVNPLLPALPPFRLVEQPSENAAGEQLDLF